MIVKPSVTELLEHADNRYALVIATSKRARQIAKEERAAGIEDKQSVVTKAANEIAEGKVKIVGEEDDENQIEEEKGEE